MMDYSKEFEATSKEFEATSKEFEATSKEFEATSKEFEATSKEFEALAEAYEASGGTAAVFLDKDSASLAVNRNRILCKNEIRGIRIDGTETPDGATVKIFVEPGIVLEKPVHLCFGVVPSEGVQEIISEYEIGDGSSVTFLAHCSFPNAIKVKHAMDARIRVGKKAEMTYSETHYHGESGGVEVLPLVKAVVDEGGILKNEFKLIKGSAGRIQIDYVGDLKKDAVCELDARIYGKKDDRIIVKESIHLNGINARGLAKSRIVSSERCQSEVIGEAIGNAPFSRGHIDCVEIVKGAEARASAIPRLVVVDDRAKLTHEAAIGSVDKKQVETLMARGLDEDEAADVVVRGMLK
jgi:Fe-S cluster assembly scaffold protein SufB